MSLNLVAYDESSDESEDDSDQTSHVKANGVLPIQTNSISLFRQLPTPKTNSSEIEEVQDEFLLKKEKTVEQPAKKSIKIAVPSLADFDSDEDDEPEKRASKQPKSSGLFAILPPPKGTPLSNTTFVPNIVKRKAAVKPKPTKKIVPKQKVIESNPGSEDEMPDVPDTFDDKLWEKLCVPQKRVPKRKVEEVYAEPEAASGSGFEIAPEPVRPYDGLDNAAFKELVGRTKRRPENIRLIDINEEEVLPEKDLWLTKSLTDPNLVPKEDTEEPVNDTCKRKHHITYLAQQAKANEQELQNQWSQNKYNRKLTQSKYGF